MIKIQLFIAGALFAGVAIGYFAGGHGTAPIDADGSPYVAKKSVSDRGEAASVQALRRRVAELERLLAEKDDAAAEPVPSEVEVALESRPRSPQEWLENLKTNDPARYVQMTNHWAQWRQRRAEQTQSRLEFLSSIDVSRMGARAQETHNALMDLIVRREEIVEQLHRENLSESDRHRLMDEMRSTDRELRKQNGQERNNLISMAVRNSGVKGPMVKELTATIRDVIEATDGGMGGPHGGHHGPPPGGPHGR